MKTYADGEVKVTEIESFCDKHGAFTAKVRKYGASEWGGSCPVCAVAEQKKAEADDEEYNYTQRVFYANLPAKFHAATMSHEQLPQQAAGWVTSALSRSSSGPLVLAGSVGTGKTHIGVSILRLMMRKGFYGKYISAIEYGRKVRESWSKRTEETEQAMLEAHAKAGILILDEIGANRAADESMIQDLICARYDSGGMPRTVIITNLAAGGLEKAIGERAADRIREGATLVTLQGESRRRPAA